MNYCYFNGKIIPEKDAKISVNDIGLLRGFGIFDYMRTYNGKLVLADRHFRRFRNSAKEVGLKIPVSDKEIRKIIEKLIKKNKVRNAGIRIVLTGGESSDGLTFSLKTPTFFILTQELKAFNPEFLTRGVKLITHENLREKNRAKTINYVTKLSLKKAMESKKAYEILYIHEGNILECSTCNFYIFKGDVLITAKDNILLGTRRGMILQLAKKRFKIEERPVSISELKEAAEAFISSTTRGIIPVTVVDDIKIGDGKVGKNTKDLINLLDQKLLFN